MKVTLLHPSIVFIEFPTRRDLTETFLRFQEHYESPEWAGKVFTLGQYREWYARTRGAFTYHQDWSGMNIPSYALDAFKRGLFDPLTEKEAALLELFKDRQDKFYIIAGAAGDTTVRDHEVAHGLYYVSPDYRAKVDEALANLPTQIKEEFRHKLLSLGYADAVIDDEMQAYLSCGKASVKERPGVDVPEEICKLFVSLREKAEGK